MRTFVGICVVLALFVMAAILTKSVDPRPPAPGERFSENAPSVKESAPSVQPRVEISVRGTDLLRDYEHSEAQTDKRMKGNRVLLTGRLVQIFFPSLNESLRMARNNHEANAFLMIDSAPVPPSNPAEALFTPGIAAHSQNGSFFGYGSFAEHPLQSGQMVTVACESSTYDRIHELTGGPKSMFGDIAVSLFDCVLNDDQPDAGEGKLLPPEAESPRTQEAAPIVRVPPADSPLSPAQQPQ